MKFLGHPIHLMFVHFPAALFPFEFACAFLAFYTGDKAFVHASFYAMTGGVVLGWLAITFGSLDLINVFKNKPNAVNTAIIHGSINICVVIAYTVLVYLQYENYPSLKMDSFTVLNVKAGIINLMFLGNYLGGSLILKYKVAVEND